MVARGRLRLVPFLIPCALALFAAPSRSQSAAKNAPPGAVADSQVEWVTSWADALRIAQEQKKPVFAAFNMDDEVANDEMAKTIYHDRRFVAKSREFVCVACSKFKHEETVDGGGAGRCNRFGHVSCAEHQKCEIRAREALIGGPIAIAPQHIIVTGDGKVLARRAYTLPLDELVRLMDDALKLAISGGASDPKAERARIDELLKQAEKAPSYSKAEPVQAIVDLGTDQARNVLIEYLSGRDSDDGVRTEICRKIGKSGDYLVLDALRKMTKDSKTMVALAAVDGLAKLRLPEAKEDLKKLLGVFKAGNDYGRVLRAYASCGREDKEALDLVLKRAKGSDQNVRSHAIIALRFFASSPEIVAFLDKALSDRNTVARACAAYTVGMGRHQECKAELAKLAGTETIQDLKDMAVTALAHLDHDPADESCCYLEGRISSFVSLGEYGR